MVLKTLLSSRQPPVEWRYREQRDAKHIDISPLFAEGFGATSEDDSIPSRNIQININDYPEIKRFKPFHRLDITMHRERIPVSRLDYDNNGELFINGIEGYIDDPLYLFINPGKEDMTTYIEPYNSSVENTTDNTRTIRKFHREYQYYYFKAIDPETGNRGILYYWSTNPDLTTAKINPDDEDTTRVYPTGVQRAQPIVATPLKTTFRISREFVEKQIPIIFPRNSWQLKFSAREEIRPVREAITVISVWDSLRRRGEYTNPSNREDFKVLDVPEPSISAYLVKE